VLKDAAEEKPQGKKTQRKNKKHNVTIGAELRTWETEGEWTGGNQRIIGHVGGRRRKGVAEERKWIEKTKQL